MGHYFGGPSFSAHYARDFESLATGGVFACSGHSTVSRNFTLLRLEAALHRIMPAFRFSSRTSSRRVTITHGS